MMKKIFLILFAFVALVPGFAAAGSIKNFDATYELPQNAIIQVTESVEYDFEGEYKHGIYRFIPYKYFLDDGSTHRINLDKFSVKDENGHSYEYEKYSQNNNVVLKIGDPDRTITGVHTYIIKYQVKGGIRYYEEGDELYWNVNGNGWDVPVENISATIIVPDSVRESDIRTACWAGAYNSTTECDSKSVTKNIAIFESANLEVGEGLSIDVGVPAGTFEVIDAGFMGSGISDTAIGLMVLSALALVLFVFIFMLRHWWKNGRDPKGRGTIVAEYDPPNGLTPIEMGTLLDNRVDSKDLSAEIIYLAVLGYIKIKKEKKRFLKGDDYTLIKLKEAGPDLKGFDLTIFSGIFLTSSAVKISELKTFYTSVNTAKSQVHGKLVKDGYFKEKVANTIGKYIAIAGGIAVLGIVVSLILGAFTNGVGAFIFGSAFAVSAGIVALFGLFMPARTPKGVEVKEHILGLKEYMKVAESDRIKFHNAPDKNPKKFEQLLPYAMVLGVEKEWAKQFEGIYNSSPGWYSDSAGGRFMPIIFVGSLNNFSNVATQNMFSAPSSSGSGFGGGGFSGGGFGGGGGGSW